MTNEIEYFIRNGKTSAKFTVGGHQYKVLVHFIHDKWQYYVKAHDCEAILNLDDQIFDKYGHDPVKVARRLDYELSDIYNMVSEWRPA